MKKTYTTLLPDQVGAFMAATEIMTDLGLNVSRASYNKAVDAHMLFIEVEGDEAALDEATARLAEKGYLQSNLDLGTVILLEFKLRDVPGSILPVLKLISSFDFNISYISSQADGGEYQFFRMGLFVDNSRDISEFLNRASRLCDIRIVDYNKTEKVLDNTVFYISFAGGIAGKLGLSDAQKDRLIVDSNRIMEMLDRLERPFYRTFEYIGKFADLLYAFRGAGYRARTTQFEELGIALIEPPCGSNVCAIRRGGEVLLVDGGFPCFREDTLACLREAVPGFDALRKLGVLTHADVDHCGLIQACERVSVNRDCAENFARERAGADNFREEIANHAPYVRISKILTGYEPPGAENLRVIGEAPAAPDAPLSPTGTFEFAGLTFELYVGAGGHIRGEMILVERRLRIAFTGDVYVNLREFTPEQAAFNRLAPYLMTSVDSDPARAAKERAELYQILGAGEWLLFGGHGAAKKITI